MTRKFIPGTDWIYMKIYSSRSYIDKILINEIYSLCNSLLKRKFIESFFFLRYNDPHFHLRFRMKLVNAQYFGQTIQMINKKIEEYVCDDIIWKVDIDTYDREIERYNPLLIDITEQLFYIDSLYSIKILRLINKSGNEDDRWKSCFISIDKYLEIFCGDNISDKIETIKGLSDSFKAEFRFNDYNSKILNKLYRDQKDTIDQILNNKHSICMNNIYTLIEQRSKKNRKIKNDLVTICKKNNIEYNQYISSYIHMNINRMIPTLNRLHELIIYNHMTKYYNSLLSRNKYNT